MHRMDPVLAREEVTAAGFALEAQSDLLKNPDDPKDVAVRDGAVQGHTEKFAYRFRKPN
jgi:predicted methyltransferase